MRSSHLQFIAFEMLDLAIDEDAVNLCSFDLLTIVSFLHENALRLNFLSMKRMCKTL